MAERTISFNCSLLGVGTCCVQLSLPEHLAKVVDALGSQKIPSPEEQKKILTLVIENTNWYVALAFIAAGRRNTVASIWWLGRIQSPVPHEMLLSFGRHVESRKHLLLDLNVNDLLAGDREALIRQARENARAYFEKRDFMRADDYLQQANALIEPFLTPLAAISLFASGNQVLPSIPEKLGYVEKVSQAAEVDKHIGVLNDPDSPNRKAFAELIVASLPDNAKLLDVGCYSGSLLLAIERAALACTKHVQLRGIEPIGQAVDFLKRHYPHLNVRQANMEDLTSNQLDKDFVCALNCMVLSAVCEVIHPRQLDNLLAWAASNVNSIAIADDIVNVDGVGPIFRGHVDSGEGIYMLHPYRRRLEEHGFFIERIELAPESSRPVTGFILAKNQRESPGMVVP